SIYTVFFFFFSSRRRHTRSTRDWSSDVCSSDLPTFCLRARPCSTAPDPESPPISSALWPPRSSEDPADRSPLAHFLHLGSKSSQIGRASCRERGESWVCGGRLTQKVRSRQSNRL